MAVTLSLAALSGALRLGDSAAEQAEAVRLLAYATEAVRKACTGGTRSDTK